MIVIRSSKCKQTKSGHDQDKGRIFTAGINRASVATADFSPFYVNLSAVCQKQLAGLESDNPTVKGDEKVVSIQEKLECVRGNDGHEQALIETFPLRETQNNHAETTVSDSRTSERGFLAFGTFLWVLITGVMS